MTFGKNKGFSLKEIYQYKPSYLEYLVEYGWDFEIDIKDFENLPLPTIADPDQISLKEGGSTVFYPPVKLETSVRLIKEYIDNGGKSRQIKFNFSNKSIEILKLRSIGQYVAPEYIKKARMTAEDLHIQLPNVEGTFYLDGKNSIYYFRFYRDKTVLHAVVVKPVIPLDIV